MLPSSGTDDVVCVSISLKFYYGVRFISTFSNIAGVFCFRIMGALPLRKHY
jgi:hypothetical protein